MNKEYMIIDDTVIVEDENREKRIMENSSNLEEILIQENIVETIENKLKEIEKLEKIDNDARKYNKRWYIPIIVIVLSVNISLLLMNSIFFNSILLTEKIGISLYCLLNFLSFYFGGMLSLIQYKSYKKSKKRLQGYVNEKENLELILKEIQENLMTLKNSLKQTSIDKKIETKKVDDKEEISQLLSYGSLYYDCGYNEDKYTKYYQKGILDKKLLGRYTEYGVELIEDYLEDKQTKGKTRVLKK